MCDTVGAGQPSSTATNLATPPFRVVSTRSHGMAYKYHVAFKSKICLKFTQRQHTHTWEVPDTIKVSHCCPPTSWVFIALKLSIGHVSSHSVWLN